MNVEVKDILVVLIILFMFTLSGGLMYVNRSDINSTIMVAIFALSIIVAISLINLLVNRDKWSETAFGLPKNSIRATIVLVFVTMVVLIGLNFSDGRSYQELPEWLLGLVGTVVGFYFGERKSHIDMGYAGVRLARKEEKEMTGRSTDEKISDLPKEEKLVTVEAVKENVADGPEEV